MRRFDDIVLRPLDSVRVMPLVKDILRALASAVSGRQEPVVPVTEEGVTRQLTGTNLAAAFGP